MHTAGTTSSFPWNGTMPKPGELNPARMPTGEPGWPMSKDMYWGSPKIGKVVRCSDIPKKFRYNTDTLYYCDRMPNETSTISSVDEAYATWRSLVGIWPPTKTCKNDQAALDEVLATIAPPLVGSNCSVAFK